MKTLTDQQEIASVQDAFESTFAAVAADVRTVKISHPAGVADRPVWWIPDHGVWGHFGLPPSEKSRGKRYWNVFGLGEPGKVASIVCEINPPLGGVNRQAAGVFAESGDEQHIFHRGNLNVFRGRIRRDFIKQHFAGVWRTVDDVGRWTEMIHIGQLGGKEIIGMVADFVREVDRIKQLYRQLSI